MKSFKDLREAASVRTADKKPEQYIGPDGKPKMRMVPVNRQVIKREQAEDDMPASPDEKSMAMDQAKFLKYVGKEITEYLNKNKEFPEWMQNKLSGLHEKAKDMHAVLTGDYEDEDEEDLDEETLEFIDSMLDEGYDLDDVIDALVDQELEEGSIKGSGTDRKAQLKKAYRAGEQKTRDFYKNKITPAPRTKDKGIKKAFAAGQHAGDGSPTPQGSRRSSSQDSLKGTEHDQSRVSPTSKSFRSTHRSKMYGLSKKPNLPK